jgi:DNA-directed RNA polymerase alpha subunit
VILALVLFNMFPRSKSDPSELAVSISTPASATPAPAASEDSQALLEGFKQFQKIQGSEAPAVSEPASAATAKEAPEKSQALLDKFMQWQQRK